MDVLVGTATTVWVDFVAQTGMMVPDAGSVSYSLYNHVGTPLVSNQSVSPGASATGVAISVLGNQNTIDPSRRFEKRTLLISWVSSGQSYSARRVYRVVPFAPYSATPEAVRTFIGLNEDELTDAEIDMFDAYLRLDDMLADGVLDAALQSGTLLESQANEAIVMMAVIATIPSLQLRTPQATADGTDAFKRFQATPDFATLETQAYGRLGALVSLLGPVVTSVAVPTFITLSTVTDAITG